MEQNKKMEYSMEKTYSDLKRECNSKEFNVEAALSEYIDNSIQSILDDYNNKHFSDSEKDVVNELEKANEKEKEKIINELQDYKLTITMSFYSKLQNENHTSNYAILEIQDNACGIAFNDLNRCMDTNKTIQRKKKNTMHYFGIGMKISSFWLGDNTIIYTKTKNDDFVSIGNYNSLDDNFVLKTDEQVKMSIEKDYSLELKNKIGESGTILKIQKLRHNVVQKMFDIDTFDSEQESVKNKEVCKTLGMKYGNYIKNKILNLELKICDADGNVKTLVVEPYSLEEYDDNVGKSTNPFIISKFYEHNLKDQREMHPTIDAFQKHLKDRLFELASDPKNELIKHLYENNYEFKHLFDDLNKPLKFEMECPIKDYTFPIKVGFLNKGEQRFSNVNVMAQWRYIHMPCFSQNSEIIHQYVLSNSWKNEQVTAKWSYIEFNLRDLPGNENFELFAPDRNKTEFIEVSDNNQISINKRQIFKALNKVKVQLIPLTDLLKSLDLRNTASIKKYKPANDEISKKIKNSNEDSFEFKTKTQDEKILFDRIKNSGEKIIEKIDDKNFVIYSNNNICELKDDVDQRTLLFIKISQDYLNDIKFVRDWIEKNEWIKSFNHFDEIKEVLDKYEDIENIGEYIKNV